MTDEVSECFRRIIEKREGITCRQAIDGIDDFLFLSKHGQPMDAARWQDIFTNIHRKYSGMAGETVPKVTPHICRHTFCSKMAKKGMNPKTLQYIMGHSDINITLNTYTHVQYEDAEQEMKRLCRGRKSKAGRR